jgi:AcrR family transcriptional regulator
LSTEERVRQAALGLFAKKGFQATGIRDIATEAGISVASLYHYMSTKDDLLLSIMEYGLKRLTLAGRWMVDNTSGGPVEQLAALTQLHVWTHGVRQQSTLVVDREIRSLSGDQLQYILSLRDGYEHLWRDVIRRGAAEGSMDVLNPKLSSFALLEMCTGVSHWYSATGELSLLHIAEVYADAALGLVRATRDGAPVRIAQLSVPNPEDVPESVLDPVAGVGQVAP